MTDRGGAWTGRLLVHGAGLIGTSVALAARAAGADVWLTDPDPDRLAIAASLGAGTPVAAALPPADLTLVAAPPAAVGAVAAAELARPDAGVVTHVCSVQAYVQREVEASRADVARFVGGHPIAGRTSSGPAHASAELFADRVWAVCPAAATAAGATEAVIALATACRARPVVLPAAEHDRLLASLSHLPQLVASALAARLLTVDPGRAGLAGSGLRDTTRLADSQPAMWAEIAAANAPAIAAALLELADELRVVGSALAADPAAGSAAVRSLVERGRAGRALLPGKHGGVPVRLVEVQVVVPDRAGALAELLAAVAGEQVNLEDMRVEHEPGQPAGIAHLAVVPQAQDHLVQALRAAGWAASAGGGTAG